MGFLGIQFAFALQNADVSRIFQTLGANLQEIPILWVAAAAVGAARAADHRLCLGPHLDPAATS